MALDFGGKQKAEEKFREELRVLSTHIETINQQLSEGGGGAGGPALGKSFSDVSTKLTFLYEFLKGLQADLRANTKESFSEVQKSVNSTLKKNLTDIYNSQQETLKTVQAMQKQINNSPAFNANDISDIRKTLSQLITIYREEVSVFRSQNQFLQDKLESIEKKLGK